ncbi:MAG: HpcH/HpaI aldolase/citrate lyase family protein [Pseudomonadota bacterium]
MEGPSNPLKAALAEGQAQIGIWLALSSPASADIAAQSGFDWALIDAEHGANDLAAILGQLRAMGGGGVSAVVRVPENDETWLKRVLDLGVQSVLVPMVNTGVEAAAAVAATRYPPKGRRGVGGSLTRASGYGANGNYTSEADAALCVIVQAETAEALRNIDAIAGTEGVDCVFIGPADLAADMGHPGNPDAPEVAHAIERAIGRIRAAGKAVGLVTFDKSAIGRLAAQGVTFLGVGGDAILLSRAMRELALDARDATGG